jgi:hypothetical protein
MQADFSVECAAGDPALEIPWSSEDGTQRFYDLKSKPELLLNIEETYDNRELADFLVALNSDHSPFQSAKCDTWFTDDLDEHDLVFGAPMKFGSYVDVVFTDPAQQLDFAANESIASQLTAMLSRIPDFASAAEFVVRRCYFHRDASPDDSDQGFCVTIYVSGYGDEDESARKNWTIGLTVVRNALLQLGARMRA